MRTAAVSGMKYHPKPDPDIPGIHNSNYVKDERKTEPAERLYIVVGYA